MLLLSCKQLKKGITHPTQAQYRIKPIVRGFYYVYPKRLLAELARPAKFQGVSLNQYILYISARRKVCPATI